MEEKIRPTKKQQEILIFIADYIERHGYSPSYREIMTGLNYTSVATVALHVSSLIKRGHLIKRDHSARSLELTSIKSPQEIISSQAKPEEEKWLVEKVDFYFKQIEESAIKTEADIEKLLILVESLKILGFESAAVSFSSQLSKIKQQINS